jgi:transcriptional regulator with XRE-family HTH domain
MQDKLTKKDIGFRVTELRKRKGLSQEDLAKQVQISRSSLTQIELGNRGVDVLEMYKLSVHLGFSLDEFLSPDFDQQADSGIQEQLLEGKRERIAMPSIPIEKFKNTLLYILERCAGKPNVGETV